MEKQFKDIGEFWKFTDHLKVQAEYEYNINMQGLSSLDFKELAGICLQYRFFTSNFATDLGYLIFRLPFGGLKSLMAQILAEELGDGHQERSHLQIYDNFLNSLGAWPSISSEKYDDLQNPLVKNLMEDLRHQLMTQSVAYGVGLRGMAGECLCQIYLSLMAENMRLNPEVRKRSSCIDWKFWEIHEGEEDIEHRIITRRAIREYIESTPGSLPDLVAGYLKGKETFDLFWDHLHEMTKPSHLIKIPRPRANQYLSP